MNTLTTRDIVFVYGALRSGTTVFRLMLNAHPQIANPGEMDFLFDHLHPDPTHPTGWRYDLAALTLNRIFQVHGMTLLPGLDGLDLLEAFLRELKSQHPEKILSINIHRHVDRIIAILPHAPLIHLLRDPRDVARSSIVMGWAGTTYHGVEHWLNTETAWSVVEDETSPPPVFTLKYETLLSDPENQLRDICNFLGLPYDPQMMDYHHGTTYSAPDHTLVQQWRHKAAPKDIAILEHRAGGMMQARGYLPEMPPVELGVMERFLLALRNKSHVWAFRHRRYGATNFYCEKLTRWLRIAGLHRHFRQRMNQIDQRAVK